MEEKSGTVVMIPNPPNDAQDIGHIRHPFRDYIEGKPGTDNDHVVRVNGSGRWLTMKARQMGLTNAAEKQRPGNNKNETARQVFEHL